MSNPYEQQPFAEPNPWQGQQSGTPVPLPQQSPRPPQQQQPPWSPQQPQQWQPSPPAPTQSKGLAITALVVACLALVMVLGVVVFLLVAGTFSSVGDLQGTAPQVVAGAPYPGALLADEVSRVISNDGGDVGSITCPETPDVRPGVAALCHGVVDGYDSEVTVTFGDGVGHFTLVERDVSGG